MTAPMNATTISASRPPTAMPIRPASQPPRKAPRTPTTMSQINPMPAPVITLLARNPAIRPTSSKTNKLSITTETGKADSLPGKWSLSHFQLSIGGWFGREVAESGPVVQVSERAGRPPVPIAEQPHDGRHHEGTHQRGVDGDRDRQPDADRLDDHHL